VLIKIIVSKFGGNMLGKRINRILAMRNSKNYIEYLRKQGMHIGEGTKIFSYPFNVTIDITRPWLINIGNNVQITKGVIILTHG